jgi:hypothetical protein
MARGPCTFKQRDLTRALVAIRRAGIAISRVEVTNDGTISVVTGETKAAIGDEKRINEWDVVG